ncbi:uncharacterized protein E0L32_002169 [Thyridium curvatum]|uniref:FAD/NAD(P)-binding domain-containing protein n=1 Tax=Thyridium curvatum TaxID=1093900 RepID=A0A507AR53_9PEZI|nr:uncharacterized protein E0L32_001964 [Thyridium curvatum]XP_030989277.1 uncharacterized protein E0L32_002169 [Thyridium curvatum]TPX07361.1 hypothetical protein E0L32_001964 [Thyridium curvatum]TPX07566.1 hypothetical protein E0L32_002169 [Thyridium curvatum]
MQPAVHAAVRLGAACPASPVARFGTVLLISGRDFLKRSFSSTTSLRRKQHMSSPSLLPTALSQTALRSNTVLRTTARWLSFSPTTSSSSPVTPLDDSVANMGSLGESAPYRVLVIGGAYAGLSAALSICDMAAGRPARTSGEPIKAKTPLANGVDVTIVDERDGYYHLIGTPLALASNEYAEKAWVRYADVGALQRPNIRVVQGSAQSVDPTARKALILKSGCDKPVETEYDYLIAASGLRRVWPVVPQALTRKQYLVEAADHIKKVSEGKHGVVVVGGGAVGIEMATELKVVHPHLKVTLVHSRDRLLSAEDLPDEMKVRTLALVQEQGVEVLLERRLDSAVTVKTEDGSEAEEITFTNGEKLLTSNVIMAISRSVPTGSGYLPKAALDKEGLVKVSGSMNFPAEVPNSDRHFACGDMVSWSGIKRCGGAMHMGWAAANNLYEAMLKESDPTHEKDVVVLERWPSMIGLAVGKTAIASGPTGTRDGDETAKMFFEDDLGFGICWRHMALFGDKDLKPTAA